MNRLCESTSDFERWLAYRIEAVRLALVGTDGNVRPIIQALIWRAALMRSEVTFVLR